MTQEEKAKDYDELLVKLQEAKVDDNICDERYCCVIDEIVPELKESEDEKIRKQIKAFIKSRGSQITQSKTDAWLEWLEKQGEQKPVDNKLPEFKDKLCELFQRFRWYKDETPTNGDILEYVEAHIQELLGVVNEQKPADKVEQKGMNIVEEDMTPFQKKVFCIIDTTIEEEQGLKQVCDELLRLAHDEIMQKPAWSEEDKRIWNIVWDMIDGKFAVSDLAEKEAKDWFVSLKDRFVPQSKQEWSEEDKESLELLINYISSLADVMPYNITIPPYNNRKRMLNFLKSLKDRLQVQPQNTWKPSDEQMKCLGYAIEQAMKDYSPLVNNRVYLTLKALKEQLEKL